MAITSPTTVRTHPAHPVSIRDVGRTFPARDRGGRDTPVLAGVDLEVEAGEIVALIGASGCGKSTLLRQISGLDTPTAGQILVDGTPVRGTDERSAVAFQEPRLLPWRTLAQNVALGLPRGTDKAAGRQRVAELLELVGLGECTQYRPRQISGGMAQRTSLARALARNPGVLVLDEPFGALDALTRLRMQDLLLDVHAAEPTTVVLVTHDVDEALYLADRVVLLGRPEGAPRGTASTVRTIVTVPGTRPRDRGDAELAHLRAGLLEGLGVHAHHQTTPTP
ncbi:ABC transporter ATP-binding protein [Actinotalea sp. BY-33]|uniref:ABC transporter ATP-binding protein n=1 Tax=Actinotalea soli TaxID=2819234 RepID=A0A939LP44_9CELL|nr:ABC transporter ATP-binding protein [Actinotalea soli]MBO1751621.1 ABC transporter ATP-binding protein [Actinotalea soli]